MKTLKLTESTTLEEFSKFLEIEDGEISLNEEGSCIRYAELLNQLYPETVLEE